MGDGWRDVTPYKRSLAEKMTYEQRSEGEKKKTGRSTTWRNQQEEGSSPRKYECKGPGFTHLREGQRGERRVARAVAIG